MTVQLWLSIAGVVVPIVVGVGGFIWVSGRRTSDWDRLIVRFDAFEGRLAAIDQKLTRNDILDERTERLQREMDDMRGKVDRMIERRTA